MDQKFLLEIIKESIVDKKKQKLIIESLRKIFLYGKKFNKNLFVVSFNKKSPKQLETLYKKKVLNSKVNMLSVKLWLIATGEINYSILSWRELDFVYKVMPKLQQILVYMNAGNKKWIQYFIDLLKFVSKINKEVLDKFPKAIDWQLLNYINLKTLHLFSKPNAKIREKQAYGYIKFLLDMFIDSANFNKNISFLTQKQIDSFMDSLFKRIVIFHNLTYSSRSKNQINSESIMKTFIPFLKELFLLKKTRNKELVVKYFSLLINRINKEEKKKRFKLNHKTSLALLDNLKKGKLTIDDLTKQWMSFILSSLKRSYLQYLKYFDTFEVVFIINLIITSLLLSRFEKGQK